MNRIGCFGGTFDPVHKGHVALAVAAVQMLELTTLIVLPVGNPYHRGRMPIASAAQRNAMLELAFADEPLFAEHGCKIIFDTREQHRVGPTYTIDTLIELRAELVANAQADSALVWIIGSDAFTQLHTWARHEELFNYAHFAVATRMENGAKIAEDMLEDAHNTGIFKHKVRDIAALFNAGTHGAWAQLAVSLPNVSSTEARAAVKAALPITNLLAPPVAQFILQHQLYL